MSKDTRAAPRLRKLPREALHLLPRLVQFRKQRERLAPVLGLDDSAEAGDLGVVGDAERIAPLPDGTGNALPKPLLPPSGRNVSGRSPASSSGGAA